MERKKVIAVNVAIINSSKKLLIAKRPSDKPMPDKWEFPGGKLEEKESLQECAIREIKEEIGIDIKLDGYLGFEELVFNNIDFVLHLFTAFKIDETQIDELHEHVELAWVDVNELLNYDFPAFDLPFIETLKGLIK